MIAKSTHNFAGGGMNQNDAPEYIPKNDNLGSWNTRVDGTNGGEGGYLTNVESNTLIQGTVHAGIPKTIGAQGFPEVAKAYDFIYNSNNYHVLREFDTATGVLTDLFTNITDSGGVSILTLDPKQPIDDIKLLNKKFLYFLDSVGTPCYINLDRLKDKSYGVLVADDFVMIRAQPIPLIKAVYANDAARSSNLMKGKLFQWRTQYEYLDFEQSFYSSISKRIYPITEQTPVTATDVTKNNNQIVTVPIGTNRVKAVNIAMTYNELDWFMAKTVDRNYILALPALIDIPNNVYEAYDVINNTYSFVFYNDGLYVPIPVLDTDEPYDAIPLQAAAMENANGNVLLLANILQGYNTPDVKAEISVAYIDKTSSVKIPTQTAPLKVNGVVVLRQIHKRNTGYFVANFTGIARVGDVINITTIDLADGGKNFYGYTVESGLDGNTLAVLNKLGSQFRLGHSVSQNPDGSYSFYFVSEANQDLLSIDIILANAGTGFTVSIPSLKSNSSYQIGLVHYDRYGRYDPLYTDAGMIVKTKSLAVTRGAVAVINWDLINSPPPPTWALSYQWVITKNTTHATTLYVNAKIYKNDGKYIQFYINSLRVFNKTNSNGAIINYQYSAGDRVTFQYWEDNSAVKHYYDAPAFDTEVVAFDPALETVVDDPTTPYVNEQKLDYILKVRRPSALNVDEIAGKNALIEIYSPAKSLIATDQPFFEIGERFDIINGQYSQLTGQISDGDVFYKSREMVSAVDEQTLETIFVEDFNYSDYYASRYTSYGRPHQYLKSVGQIRLSASIRFGQPYVKNNRVNLFNRFFAADIYGEADGQTTSVFGGIIKMAQFANTLRILQELIVGYVPVHISILEDQAEQQNVAISETFLNKIQYSQVGQVGIGLAKSSYCENRRKNASYFVDPIRSEPFRIGNDGLISIAGKMSKFFRQQLQQAYKEGRLIIGYYDDFYDEFIISVQTDDGKVLTSNFNTNNWQLLENYTVLPGGITVVQPTDASLTYDNTTGLATYQTAVAGNHNFLFNFLVNGLNVTKRVCINADGGISEIAPFTFIDLTNQEYSTLLQSNFVVITGNTVPVPISIVGGEYSFGDSGVWSSAPGLVAPNTSVKVRQISAATSNVTTNAVLTVGNRSDSFDVTTKTLPPAKVTVNLTEQGNVNSTSPPYADSNALVKDNGVQVSTRLVTNGTDISYVAAGHQVQILAFVELATTGSNPTLTMNITKNGQQLSGWPQTVAGNVGASISYTDTVASLDEYVATVSAYADSAQPLQP